MVIMNVESNAVTPWSFNSDVCLFPSPLFYPFWINIQISLKYDSGEDMPQKAKYVCESCGEECGSKAELDKHKEIYHAKKAAVKKK